MSGGFPDGSGTSLHSAFCPFLERKPNSDLREVDGTQETDEALKPESFEKMWHQSHNSMGWNEEGLTEGGESILLDLKHICWGKTHREKK